MRWVRVLLLQHPCNPCTWDFLLARTVGRQACAFVVYAHLTPSAQSGSVSIGHQNARSLNTLSAAWRRRCNESSKLADSTQMCRSPPQQRLAQSRTHHCMVSVVVWTAVQSSMMGREHKAALAGTNRLFIAMRPRLNAVPFRSWALSLLPTRIVQLQSDLCPVADAPVTILLLTEKNRTSAAFKAMVLEFGRTVRFAELRRLSREGGAAASTLAQSLGVQRWPTLVAIRTKSSTEPDGPWKQLGTQSACKDQQFWSTDGLEGLTSESMRLFIHPHADRPTESETYKKRQDVPTRMSSPAPTNSLPPPPPPAPHVSVKTQQKLPGTANRCKDQGPWKCVAAQCERRQVDCAFLARGRHCLEPFNQETLVDMTQQQVVRKGLLIRDVCGVSCGHCDLPPRAQDDATPAQQPSAQRAEAQAKAQAETAATSPQHQWTVSNDFRPCPTACGHSISYREYFMRIHVPHIVLVPSADGKCNA